MRDPKTNEPMKERLVNGDGSVLERYVTDPEGIEIFNTVDGPLDEPSMLEPFPKATAEEVKRRLARMNDADAAAARAELAAAAAAEQAAAAAAAAKRKRELDSSEEDEDEEEGEEEIKPARAKVEMRMDPEAVLKTVESIIDGYPAHFKDVDDARAWWQRWAAEAPMCASDVPSEHRPQWQWPAECPDEALPPSATEMAAAYKESIAYVNAVGGSRFTVKQRDDADAEEQKLDLNKIEEGEKLFVLAPKADDISEELRGGAAQWHTPLWLCQAEERSYVTDTDCAPSLQVSWWACNPSAHGNLAGNWFPMCKGGHKLLSGCRGHGHGKWIGEIERKSIRVTGVELNKKDRAGTCSLYARKKLGSRAQFAQVLQSMKALEGNVPSDWLPDPTARQRAPNKGRIRKKAK